MHITNSVLAFFPSLRVASPCDVFFRYEPLFGFFFMFWSFQPQTDSRSADIRKPLMPLDTHGNTLAGCGRTTEVFCLSPCGSGGASSSYFFFFHFLLLANRQEGEGGDKTKKKKKNGHGDAAFAAPSVSPGSSAGFGGDEETPGARGPRGRRRTRRKWESASL